MKITIENKSGKLKKDFLKKSVSILADISIDPKVNFKNPGDKDININIDETDKESSVFVEINEKEIKVNYNINENEKDDEDDDDEVDDGERWKMRFFKSDNWVDRIVRWADKKEKRAKEKGLFKKIRKGTHFYHYGQMNFFDDENRKEDHKKDK